MQMSKSWLLTKMIEPIWNEDQKDTLDPILDFLEEASKKTNEGNSQTQRADKCFKDRITF